MKQERIGNLNSTPIPQPPRAQNPSNISHYNVSTEKVGRDSAKEIVESGTSQLNLENGATARVNSARANSKNKLPVYENIDPQRQSQRLNANNALTVAALSATRPGAVTSATNTLQ